MSADSEEKIARIDSRVAQLEARKKRLLARNRKDARKKDTRRKILIGATIMRWSREQKGGEDWLIRILDQHLTAYRDRKLFGLKTEEDHNENH